MCHIRNDIFILPIQENLKVDGIIHMNPYTYEPRTSFVLEKKNGKIISSEIFLKKNEKRSDIQPRPL